MNPTIPFSPLPDDVFDLDHWHEILKGRWNVADHITLGEGRAVVKLLDIISQCINFHRLKVVSLEDNRPVSGSMAKGRSAAGALNFLCRRKAARTLAASLRILLPWVETKRMPADDLSRML